MAMNFEQWTTSASDVVILKLQLRSHVETFDASYTEAIYGQDNIIIGYKKPQIDITFRATDMLPCVRTSYSQKIDPGSQDLEKLMDMALPLRDFLPASAFEPEAEEDVKEAQQGWTPPGALLHTYTNEGQTFQVWCASLADSRAIAILKNMKILVPLYIEGGTTSFLDDDESPQDRWTIERWKLFTVYTLIAGAYSLVGFSTSYRLSTLPTHELLSSLNGNTSGIEAEPSEEDDDLSSIMMHDDAASSDMIIKRPSQYPSRERISQFIILPPYQASCHGIQLYSTIYSKFHADPRVFEITVEDPNESFDNLRDYCDLAVLYRDPDFVSLSLPESIPANRLKSDCQVPVDLLVPRNMIETLCVRHKMIKRQVERLIELHLLKSIPTANRSLSRLVRGAATANVDDRKYFFWRLLVKHRVWSRNWSELGQIEEDQRIPKIESATDSLKEGYEALIEGFERRIDDGFIKGAAAAAAAQANGGADRPATTRKRKVVEEDSEDEDSEDEHVAPANKRQATEELLAST
jgi:histone acetyltransferase 1